MKLPLFLLLKRVFAEVTSACLGRIDISCSSMDFKDWSISREIHLADSLGLAWVQPHQIDPFSLILMY